MKKLTLLFTMMLSVNVFAVAEAEAPKIKVKEIKAYLKTIDPSTTCMDEYIKRRHQLIVKLSLSPLIIAGGSLATAYGGAAAGAGVATIRGVDSWVALGYVVGGGLLGAAGGVVGTGISTTSTAITLRNINLILKTLGEQHLNRDGVKSLKLHAKYVDRSEKDISKEEFIARLMAADANGSLCDGSMVKQPRIKIGSKTKFKVAKLKDIVREL
jgi:hypothetical protein